MTVNLDTLRKARSHPATNTAWFRWWLLLPILAFIGIAFREEAHSLVHLLLRMPEGGSTGHHVVGERPAVEGILEVLDSTDRLLDALTKVAAKIGGLLAAASWLWLRGRPKGRP